MKPEEAIETMKKRQKAGSTLTSAEMEQLNYLKAALKEQTEANQKNARKQQGETPIAETPEARELRKKADAAREEEKRKFQGGQYL